MTDSRSKQSLPRGTQCERVDWLEGLFNYLLTKSSDAIKALRMENTQLRLQMDSLKSRARAGASGRTPLPPETRASRIREELNRRAA